MRRKGTKDLIELLVLVAAMVPRPGEAPKDWWAATGHEEAIRRQAELDGRPAEDLEDPVALFLHDVPPAVAAESADHVRPQSATIRIERANDAVEVGALVALHR